jgi:hypothetical protein
MRKAWKIVAEWELLDEGSPEERACFAALGIEARGRWLTEGRDTLANRLRSAPLLSGYHLAEWFCWNWWRLRWEPRASNEDWRFAHKIANIGQGYIWPNITIFSDGERTALIGKATEERPGTTFRYINDHAAVVPSSEFESEVDNFLEQVLSRLESLGVRNTNLMQIWEELCAERRDPKIARMRKLEALLGFDPDESNSDTVNVLVENSAALGTAATEEIAADSGVSETNTVPSVGELAKTASRVGFSASPADMLRLHAPVDQLGLRAEIPAWRIGADAAQMLRRQEKLEDNPLSDRDLIRMLAVDSRAIDNREGSGTNISFVLEEAGRHSKIVLRSRWHTGRRFELARLLGDRLLNEGGNLYPATRSFTYRQKLQRSFAAELLSPFSAVLHMLEGDYSQEKQLDVAEHFKVSDVTIRTQLVNHRILDREDLDREDGDTDLATGTG